MSKETVLAQVEANLQRGDLGKARNRLHSLVFNHPNDVALRSRLAEVYHRLQFPVMAGRYWYLEEHPTPETQEAIAAFRRSCGDDPLLMLSALKFLGDPSQLPDGSRERLDALRQAVHAKYGFFPDAYVPSRMLGRGQASVPPEVARALSMARMRLRPRQRFIRIGRHYVYQWIVVAGIIVAVLVGIGLFTIASWLYEAFR